MINIKRVILSPYTISFFIVVVSSITALTIYQRDHQRSDLLEPVKHYKVESAEDAEQKPTTKSTPITTDSEKSIQAGSDTEVTDKAENGIAEKTGKLDRTKGMAQMNNGSVRQGMPIAPTTLSDNASQDTSDTAEKKKHPNANLDDLAKVMERELFKGVAPELIPSIQLMGSEEDMRSYLKRLESNPNRTKEMQTYIDVVKQSLEDKTEIEAK